MHSNTLTRQQLISLRILNENILDPKTLLKHCPLDYGRHVFHQTGHIGMFGRLPLEIQHKVLSHVDIYTLLTFRRVNQSAMAAVNSMLDYKKVMAEAADSIRMTVAIKTADRFTMTQLLAVLCQKYCTEDNCGQARTVRRHLHASTTLSLRRRGL
jgi:hypothetical protein